MKRMATLVDMIRENGKCDDQPNRRGNTVWRLHMPGERYIVDFCDDFRAAGWLQFDTDQDAPYFGVWVNPRELRTLSYCEGDWTLVECPTADTYNAEISSACEFHGAGFIAKVIDGDSGDMTTFRQDRAQFFVGEPV